MDINLILFEVSGANLSRKKQDIYSIGITTPEAPVPLKNGNKFSFIYSLFFLKFIIAEP